MGKKSDLKPKNILDFLFNEERRSSVLLLCAAGAALVIANSNAANTYFNFFEHYLKVGAVSLDIKHWINEGLMAIFFLVVGLEIKRESIDGELQTWRKAAFPVVAAIGGMVVPALIFTAFNPYVPQNSGWAIPMATDIAIALGVLGLLGNKIPKSLRIFLLTLAIVDDIGSIIIMGIFYNQPSNMLALTLACIAALSLTIVRRLKQWAVLFAGIGLALWYCLLLAGVSATLAGVVIALLMPLTAKKQHKNLQAAENTEKLLLPVTSYIIVPLFVFANAGIVLRGLSLTNDGNLSVFLGVLVGLFIGKPLGIVTSSWIGHVTKIAIKPRTITWSQLVGVGCIAGIGFTISILITDLAYMQHAPLKDAATIGIFFASFLSGSVGVWVLRRVTKNKLR